MSKSEPQVRVTLADAPDHVVSEEYTITGQLDVDDKKVLVIRSRETGVAVAAFPWGVVRSAISVPTEPAETE